MPYELRYDIECRRSLPYLFKRDYWISAEFGLATAFKKSAEFGLATAS